ncbi:MAG: agmatine deiminase family protein [Puniceicoccaceae bacterium]
MTRTGSAVRQPAEWEHHSAVWTAWPSHPEYWEGHIASARQDMAAFLHALTKDIPGSEQRERLELFVDGEEAEASLHELVPNADLNLYRFSFGDIWFRDIAPIFVQNSGGSLEYRKFGYNGWGGKYVMENDEKVAPEVARLMGLPGCSVSMIFEGGAVDVDGTGLGLTTSSCLLNPNRNPSMGKEEIETVLREHLGIETMIWLKDGLLNDHTDGHVDNIARFVAPGKVACQHPAGNDDPNREVLTEIVEDLRSCRLASGKALDVVEIPSPGRVTDDCGNILPASHLNFYISNDKVLVPVFGTETENEAVAAIADLFPDRIVTGLPAKGLLMGGGTFHCITQQQPSLASMAGACEI